jgi:pimeloyl-ACP methyl ester carboxylesterase
MTPHSDAYIGRVPTGIRSRFVDNHNGCRMHVLDAGREGRPCVLLLHGFPELAFSWRHQLLALAEAGFHAVAPDLRGYGLSSGTDVSYDEDLLPYSMLMRVADAVGLLRALGHEQAAVVGHDYGSLVAGWCAYVRPDVFRSVVMMSAPFRPPAPLPLGERVEPAPPAPAQLQSELAKLPRPRKHYVPYYTTREANEDMWHCSEGVHDFLRAYFHVKSGDHAANRPFPLRESSAEELAQLPTYYVMDAGATMPQTVRPFMPAADAIARCAWLPDDELAVYSSVYGHTGFQGGLQCYRVTLDAALSSELRAFSARRAEVPAAFVSGEKDWGNHQNPGGLDAMQAAFPKMGEFQFVEGAGHWVQQERPAEVNSALASFLAAHAVP